MFKLIWVFGFIMNGVPQIDRMKDPAGEIEFHHCHALIIQNSDRMADWLRGALRQDLDFPVGVRGECEPVQRDAIVRPKAATPRS
jgi:hypothetical protein